MGCEGSKERPDGGARPLHHQPPPPSGGGYSSYHHPPPQQPMYTGSHAPPPPPPPPPPAYVPQPSYPYDPYQSRQQQREQQEVETARRMLHHNSTVREEAERKKADTLLNQQQYATVDQLHEVYPKLDREVIRSVVNDTSGNQEECHQILGQLSGNDVNAERRHQSMRRAHSLSQPGTGRDTRWQPGDAVDALFQGQWHAAVIEVVQANGDYEVKWAEDGTNTLVTPEQTRPRQGFAFM